MINLNRSWLGAVVYKNRIAVCQIRQKGKIVEKHPAAEFLIPSELADLRDLSGLASDFKKFLEANKFCAKRAVVGFDAARVFTAVFNMPASQESDLSDEIIRIQLERKTQLEVDQMYVGHSCCDGNAFVAAVQKKQADQVKALLNAAGIRVVHMTATSLAVRPDGRVKDECQVLEYPDSVELVFIKDGQIQDIRDVSNGTDLPQFTTRIKQQIGRYALIHQRQPECTFVLGSRPAEKIKAVGGEYFASAVFKDVRKGSASLLAGFAETMAQKALEDKLPKINFLAAMHSTPNLFNFSRWARKAAIMAAAFVLVCLFFLLEWHFDNRKIADYRHQLESISKNVQQAQSMISRTGYARQWFDRQPSFLNSLVELTRCFPEGGDIWLNSMAVDESFNQIITGKASGEQAVLDVVDNLKSSKLFEDVKILYIRQAGKNTREESFAISFRFVREI